MPACMALTARKGHAASVKRQSRQRLRRERRYRRNRSVRFYRHLARTGSAFPRLPRRFAPRNDNLGECRGAPAPLHGLIPLYKAVTTRKGHAASVKRQSRQRLRRERRYSQIWQRVRSAERSEICRVPHGASRTPLPAIIGGQWRLRFSGISPSSAGAARPYRAGW